MTTLDYLLLGLLSEGPKSGYDLRKAVGDTPLRSYSSSPGAIYPALKRLQKHGCVRHSRPEGGRRRRLVEVTGKGRRALLAWLQRPVEADDVVSGGDALMLRFALMGPMGLDEAALAFLDQYEGHNRTYLAALREYHRGQQHAMPLTGRLAFEHGLQQFEARIRWARACRTTLRPAAPKTTDGDQQ